MKVIVAGYSKTGTKTMVVALTMLGYKVYDYVDHFWYHGEEWNKILSGRGSIEDFKRMYEDVDACTDGPAHHFWEEIHEAFPDSKIILTTRDVDSWFKSFKNQFEKFEHDFTYKMMQFLSPTGWKYFRFVQNTVRVLYGWNMNHPFQVVKPNELIFKRNYRQSQTYCMQNAPQDKLLVYNVKEGWKPLCEFLGNGVPDKPFPHKNKGGDVLKEKMANDPVALTIQKEMKITIFLLVLMLAILIGVFIKFVI